MVGRTLVAALALLATTACGSARSSVTGPTRAVRPPVPPRAYAHYVRGRVAVYEGDYAAAVSAFRRARRVAPHEPELTAALAEATLLYLSGQ